MSDFQYAVALQDLPSQGATYPKDIEISLKPLTVKEELALERYAQSNSGYYRTLLQNVLISGNFSTQDLLFVDVQFLDLLRKLISFDITEEIKIGDVVCPNCSKLFDVIFELKEMKFSKIKEESIGKQFTFTDGMVVQISPVSMRTLLRVMTEYLTNNKSEDAGSEFLLAYMSACIAKVEGREFEGLIPMQKFIYNYFSNLYKYKDKKILEEIENNTTSSLSPLVRSCPHCEKDTEVAITPETRFQQ